MRCNPRRALGAIAAAALAVPAAAHAALPGVSSGQRPGPPLLYEDAPPAPQLSNTAPFAAAPLLVRCYGGPGRDRIAGSCEIARSPRGRPRSR